MCSSTASISWESALQIVTTLSFEQFRAAVLATRKQFTQQNKRTYWLRIVFVIVLSFSIAIAMQTSSEHLGDFLLVLLILAVLLVIWCKWRSDNCLRKTYEAQKNQLNGQTMRIDESGISGQWKDGGASYQYGWSAFESFLELPDGFLFFPNLVSFVRVPKDSLSLDEQQTLKRWAAQRPRG